MRPDKVLFVLLGECRRGLIRGDKAPVHAIFRATAEPLNILRCERRFAAVSDARAVQPIDINSG